MAMLSYRMRTENRARNDNDTSIHHSWIVLHNPKFAVLTSNVFCKLYNFYCLINIFGMYISEYDSDISAQENCLHVKNQCVGIQADDYECLHLKSLMGNFNKL